jgi:hypothetical protein
MSKLDRTKEEISLLKVGIGLLFATDVSLLGWLGERYNEAAPLLVIGGLIAVIVTTIILFLVFRLAFKKIGELEDL